MGDQQRVLGVHDDQVLHAHQGHEFAGAEDVVVGRVDGHVAPGVGDVALGVAAQAGLNLVLVERGPGAEIVPAELGGDAVEMGEVLALG